MSEGNGTGPGLAGWPLCWSGQWIAPEPPVQVAAVGLGGGEPGGTFSRSLFRRTFELSEVPASVPARLTADSRYVR